MNSSNQVKQLRLQRAWSQEQLAEQAGGSEGEKKGKKKEERKIGE